MIEAAHNDEMPHRAGYHRQPPPGTAWENGAAVPSVAPAVYGPDPAAGLADDEARRIALETIAELITWQISGPADAVLIGQRTLALAAMLGMDNAPKTIRELARTLNVSPSTAHRLWCAVSRFMKGIPGNS